MSMKKKGKLLRTLSDHNEAVLSCGWSPSMNLLASCTRGNGGTIYIFDTNTGVLKFTLQRSATRSIYGVSFIDETHLVSCDWFGYICVWDLNNSKYYNSSSDRVIAAWPIFSGSSIYCLSLYPIKSTDNTNSIACGNDSGNIFIVKYIPFAL